MNDLGDDAPWPITAFITMLSIYSRKLNGEDYRVVAVDTTINHVQLQHLKTPHFYWGGTYQQLLDEFYLR